MTKGSRKNKIPKSTIHLMSYEYLPFGDHTDAGLGQSLAALGSWTAAVAFPSSARNRSRRPPPQHLLYQLHTAPPSRAFSSNVSRRSGHGQVARDEFVSPFNRRRALLRPVQFSIRAGRPDRRLTVVTTETYIFTNR